MRKNVASAQELIWEQRVRPSHLYGDDTRGSGVVLATVGADASGSDVDAAGSVSWTVGFNARGSRFLLAEVGLVVCGVEVVLASTGAGCGSVISLDC